MARYPVKQVMDAYRFAVNHMHSNAQKIWLDKKAFNISRIFPMYNQKGMKCKVCDRPGTYFEEYTMDNKRYLRLMTDFPGVAITIEHTTPKSVGGTDNKANLEPTCSICNNLWKSALDKKLKEQVLGISIERRNEYLIII